VAERDPALRRRVLSALALLPVVIVVVWWGGLVFAGFVALAVALMAWEWSQLSAQRYGPQNGRIAGGTVLVIGLTAILLIALGHAEAALLCLFGGVLVAGLVTWVAGGPWGWISLGVGYLGLPALALIWLRSWEPDLGPGLLLGLLIVVGTTDTAAYFTGRALGGPRLAPVVSPSKTWSGLCGGVLWAALAGALTAWLLGSGRLAQGAGLGAILAGVAQLGDLVESAFKRAAGVKDSGKLIPGHGGVLDRVDGLLLAAPLLALLGLIAGPEALPWR
jgi:phosphatidate cytidylyltransferase